MIKINKHIFPIIKREDQIKRGVYAAYPIIKDSTINHIKSLDKFELKTLFPQYDGKDFDEIIHTPHYVGMTENLNQRIFEDHRKPSQTFLTRAVHYYDIDAYDLRERYEWRLICDGVEKKGMWMSKERLRGIEIHYQKLWNVKFDYSRY